MSAPVDPVRPARPCQRGLSLIELLVALAVFALVVLALLNLSGQNRRTAAQVEEQVLASIVADNVAIEAMLARPDELGIPAQGEETLGDNQWRWSRHAAPQPGAPGLLRIDVRVTSDTDNRLAAQSTVFRGVR